MNTQTLISKVYTVEKYLNSEEYELECGAVVQWKYGDLLNGYQLHSIKEPSHKIGCGNPFNMMNKDEYTKIKKFKDNHEKQKRPCDTSCAILTNIYSNDELLKENIQDTIGADCWGYILLQKIIKSIKFIFPIEKKEYVNAMVFKIVILEII